MNELSPTASPSSVLPIWRVGSPPTPRGCSPETRMSLLTHVIGTGELDFEDEIMAGATVTHGGQVVHPGVLALIGDAP